MKMLCEKYLAVGRQSDSRAAVLLMAWEQQCCCR